MTELPVQVAALRCPVREETLRAVRREVTGYAAAAGLVDPALYNFVMAVNEVTTNTLRHAGGAGQLRLWHDERRLVCEVTDDGPGMPADRLTIARPEPGTIGGWGLWLARQVCDRVDIRTGPTGTLVRLEYPLPPV